MEFIVSSSELLGHLSAIKGVINSKNTLPILDNFLFSLEENTLKLTASDLETTLRTELALDNASGSGMIAIEARRLTDILKEFPDQPLTFKINDETSMVEIFSQNGKFSIMGQNGEDYPAMAEIDETEANSIKIAADVVLKGIGNTLFATADDDLRPVMCGILMELTTEHFRMVASDSHKLVRFTRTDYKSEQDSAFIMSKKTSTLLKNLLAKEKGDIRIMFDSKNAYFQLSKFQMVSRLVDGKYPSYNVVIPIDNPNKLNVDRIDFYNTLKRVSIFSNQASNLAKLSLKGNELTISAQDIDFSISAYETINCRYEGIEMDIGFKSVFLLDILSNIGSSDVLLEMSDPARAGILSPMVSENENEDVLMLIMPMMV
jgi:DNA polymerase III subunit beta